MANIVLTNGADSAPADLRGLIDAVDCTRAEAFRESTRGDRGLLGQFPTPPGIARFMAAMLSTRSDEPIRLLDAGAGIGALTASVVAEFCGRYEKPNLIEATAFEIDLRLQPFLRQAFDACRIECRKSKVRFDGFVRSEDFIKAAVEMINSPLFGSEQTRFNVVIMNPPYKKISSASEHRAPPGFSNAWLTHPIAGNGTLENAACFTISARRRRHVFQSKRRFPAARLSSCLGKSNRPSPAAVLAFFNRRIPQ